MLIARNAVPGKITSVQMLNAMIIIVEKRQCGA
jgi:hypothetical protein